MSPRYIPPEQRAEICRLLAEKWDTGEATFEEIAEQLGVSSGTVGRENYVRVGGAKGMDAALERRKAAMGKRAYVWTDKKPGPKPDSENAGRPKGIYGENRENVRRLWVDEGMRKPSEIAAKLGIDRVRVYQLLKSLGIDVKSKSLS